MYQVEENGDTRTLVRALKRGDRTWTLVGQDKSSPKTICFWIMENIETAPEDKLLTALQDAIAMRNAKNRKNAD